MKNITVIPSFTGSPIHKKSWSLRINQGRAIYCFTLPLSTWTASCVVDSDYHHHHHCSYDFLSVHMMFFIDPNCHRVKFHPTHISQQSPPRLLSILDCDREELTSYIFLDDLIDDAVLSQCWLGFPGTECWVWLPNRNHLFTRLTLYKSSWCYVV